MSTPTHSPAPWKFRGSYLRDANGTELFCEVPNGLPIAQDDANRRLIESAPELRHALQELLDSAPGPETDAHRVARELLGKLEGTP